jgi:peptide/nickel transport system permease protein
VRRFIAARLLQSVIVVLLVTTISFFLIRLAPGDPFSFVGDFSMSEAVRNQLRAQFGYDRPMIEQFVLFLGNVAHGRLGYSQSMHRYVGEVLLDVLPRTLLLMGVALVLAFVIGVAVGALQAVRRESWLDRTLSGVLLLFYSIPDFWLALMALLAFAYWLPLFPPGGMIDQIMHDYMSLGGRIRDIAAHLILPSITLALLTAAGIARYQRCTSGRASTRLRAHCTCQGPRGRPRGAEACASQRPASGDHAHRVDAAGARWWRVLRREGLRMARYGLRCRKRNRRPRL